MLKLLVAAILTLPSMLSHALTKSDQQCLSTAIYHEANTQSDIGKRAVMDVILNRAKVTGKSICQVIAQPGQFSWFAKKPLMQYNDEMKDMMRRLHGVGRVLISENYLWFFQKKIKRPKWARSMECFQLEDHLFCAEVV